MEPPPEEFYPRQRQHQWEGSRPRQHDDGDEREENEFSRQHQHSSSRGRSSNRYQTTSSSSGSKLTMSTHQEAANRPSSHSKSNTPRRKGNPQSCSPSKSRSPNKYNHTNHHHHHHNNISSTSNNSIDGSLSSSLTSPQLTPLSTLSAILTTHASHSHTSLQLYRQSHALHRHATERKSAAIEKLRLAQAELEHATTAQEYAAEELSQSTIQKNEAQVAFNSICKKIRHQSKPFVNRRVKLVGLNKNAMWNGRLGSVVKLVSDGSSDDVGRWKVKLDPEWRGRDADGKRLARCDTVSLDNTHDSTPPKNTASNENGQQGGGEEGTAANNMNVVVAKAENLELIDYVQEDGDERDYNEIFGSNIVQQQRSAGRSSQQQQQQRKSRDPSIARRSTNDPVAEVTPESTPVKYHEKNKSESKDRQSVHPKHQQQRNNTRTTSSSKQNQRLGSRQVSPSKKSQRPWQQQQQQQQQSSPYVNNKKNSSSTSRSPSTNNKSKKNSSSSLQQYATPIRRCPSNDSARISSAFSQMLLSPVSFAPVSFQPEPTDSFQRWVENDDNNEQYHPRQYDERGYGRQHQQQQHQYIASAGSFFDEVTSLEKNDFGEDGNYDNYSYNYNDNEWVNEEEEGNDPQLYYDPSTPGDTITTNTMNEQERLPNIVVLPVPEDDDTDSNPFLSPGYTSSSPPHCVGVQNAGVSHVNGVYLLAYPKDDQNNNGGPNDNNTPPLYFRDGPPILLSDNRYYDMCILRIPCPDSADHVIWFLARVDVDPNCLDVKFSDCYYYCRMLRNDDGMGGERDDGCRVPPLRGWNIPKIPPGVEMLSIGATRSGSFSTSSLGHHHDGLGIGPRPPTSVRVSGKENGEGEVISEFVSPGMDSSKMSSKYSI